MNSMYLLLDTQFCLRLALVLGHFLWQGAVLALAAAILAGVLRRASSRIRYGTFVAMLALMCLCPVATYFVAPVPEVSQSVGFVQQKTGTVPAFRALTPGSPAQDSTPSSFPATASESHPSLVSTSSTQSISPDRHSPESTVPSLSLLNRIDLAPYAPWISLAYLAGVAMMLVRLVLAMRGGRGLRKHAEPIDTPGILEALEREARALGMAAVPAIAYCERVVAPTIVGLLRPIILLPGSLVTGLAPGQLDLLLRHELAHIRRYDHLVNILQSVIEAILFFHPGVWYVSRKIRIEREHCCDDLVLAGGGEAMAYAKSLVQVAELSHAVHNPAAGLHATGKPSQLRARILRLLEGPKPHVRLTRLGALALTALVLIAATTVVHVAAVDDSEPAESGESTETVAEESVEADVEESSEEITETARDLPTLSPEAAKRAMDALLVELGELQAEMIKLGLTYTDESPPLKDLQRKIAVKESQIAALQSATEVVGDKQRKVAEISGQSTLAEILADPELLLLLRSQLEGLGDVELLAEWSHEGRPASLIFSAEGDGGTGAAASSSQADELARAVENKDWWLRKMAIEQLGETDAPGAVDTLIAALQDGEYRVQAAAARALGKKNDPKAVPYLVAVLEDNGTVSEAAAQALSAIDSPEVMRLLRKVIEEDFDSFIVGAAAALGHIGSDEAIALLLEAAERDDVRNARENIVDALASMPAEQVTEPLVAALHGEDTRSIRTAISALGQLGGDRARDALVAFVREGKPHLTKDGVVALRGFEGEAVTVALLEVLNGPRRDAYRVAAQFLAQRDAGALMTVLRSEDESAVQVAAEALGELGDDGAMTGLIDFVRESKSCNAVWAVVALSHFQDEAVTEVLLEAMSSPFGNIQHAAANALAERKCEPEDPKLLAKYYVYNGQFEAAANLGEVALEPLLNALSSKGFSSEQAVWALGMLGDPRAIEPLEGLLASPNDSTRAAEALCQIGGPEVVEPLIRALKNHDQNVRTRAASGLGEHGDERAVEPLCGALKDVNSRVRSAAAEALGRVGDERAISPLIAALGEGGAHDRAKQALVRLQNYSGVVEPLLALVTDDANRNVPARTAAAEVLVDIGDEEVWSRLAELEPAIQNVDVREEVHRTISTMKRSGKLKVAEKLTPEGAPGEKANVPISPETHVRLGELATQLRDEDWWLRKVAAQKLGDADVPDNKSYLSALVDTLIHALKDEDPRVQAAAAESLGKRGDPKAIKHLVAVLKEKSAAVRSAAAEALVRFDDPQVLELLGLAVVDEDEMVRQGAIEALGRMDAAKAAPLLIHSFSRASDTGRYLAVYRLLWFGPEHTLKPMTAALAGTDAKVALGCAEVLGRLAAEAGPESPAYEEIAEGLSDLAQKPDKRVVAIAGLVHLKDESVTDALEKLLADPDFEVSRAAGKALQARNYLPKTRQDHARFYVATEQWDGVMNLGADAVEPLILALHTKDKEPQRPRVGLRRGSPPPLRQSAAAVLGDIGDVRAVDPLMAMLGDENEGVRREVVEALRKIRESRAALPVAELLSDPNAGIRQAAARALAEFKNPGSVDALILALNDSEPGVRNDTALALGLIGDPKAIEPLVDTLDDVHGNVASAAMRALGRIQDPRMFAIVAAIVLDTERDQRLRGEAAKALAAIDAARAFTALKPTLETAEASRNVLESLIAKVLLDMDEPEATAIVEQWLAQPREKEVNTREMTEIRKRLVRLRAANERGS